MTRPTALFLAVASLLFFAAPAMGSNYCEDTAEFTPSSKPDTRIVNNIWNRNVEGSQYLFKGRFDGLPVESVSGEDALGSWMWRWGYVDNTPHSYPSIAFGHQPWRSYSTTKTLPALVGDVEGIEVSYKLAIQAEGSYNASFEMWFTTGKKPEPKHVETEIMVWVGDNQLKPFGTYVEDVTLGGKTYEIWLGKVQWWRYVVFRAKEHALAGSVELMPIVDEAARRGWVKPGHYLTSVELGTEIVSGVGKAVLEQFDVKARVKGRDAAKSK